MHTFDPTTITDPVARDRLVNLIPLPVVGERYVPREIDGVSDMDAFDVALAWGENVRLEGPTGTGKSYGPRAWAALRRLPHATISCNAALDPETIWGRWTVNPDRSLSWTWSNAAYVLMYGGALVIEEVNALGEDAAAALFEVLSDVRFLTIAANGGEMVRVSPDCLIFSTMNPGYRGTRELTPAFGRRWTWPMVYAYDRSIESAVVSSSSLLDVAGEIRENKEFTTDLGTPTLITLERTTRALGIDFAIGRFVAGFRPGEERDGIELTMSLYRDRIADEIAAADDDETEEMGA